MIKMKNNFNKILCSLFIFCSFLFSWTQRTHTRIGEVIYSSLPPQYQDLLDKAEFISGNTAPDKREYKSVFKWYHVYHPRTGFGNLPTGCEELYKQSLSLLKAGKKKQGSFLLGGLVHYISDIAQPLHTDENAWETDSLHNEVEKEAESAVVDVMYQPRQMKFSNTYSFAVSIANDSLKKYDKLRYKEGRVSVLKEQYFIACDAGYTLVFDILSQVLPQDRVKQDVSFVSPLPTQPVSVQQPVTSIPVAPDAEAQLRLSQQQNPQQDSYQEQTELRQVKKNFPSKTSSRVVRVMGVILSPDKEYRLKLVPDGAGNFYLDIWEIKD